MNYLIFGAGDALKTAFETVGNAGNASMCGLSQKHALERVRMPMADSEQKAVPYEAMRSAVISMAVESWRFRRTFVRVLDKLDAGERNRYEGSLNWFMKKTCEALEQAGLTVADYEGQNFDVGMAATPLNIDEFEADDALIVDQLLEPTIMGKDGVVRKTGTITLKKKA